MANAAFYGDLDGDTGAVGVTSACVCGGLAFHPERQIWDGDGGVPAGSGRTCGGDLSWVCPRIADSMAAGASRADAIANNNGLNYFKYICCEGQATDNVPMDGDTGAVVGVTRPHPADFSEPHPELYSLSGARVKAVCVELCIANNYRYMGLQYDAECYCGNQYGDNGRGDGCGPEGSLCAMGMPSTPTHNGADLRTKSCMCQVLRATGHVALV